MKIDGNRSAAGTDPTDTTWRITPGRGAEADGVAPASQDTVAVSADVRLAQRAIDAVNQLPDIRPEAVARGRDLLASGTLGADPQRLADAMFDDVFGG